MLSNANQKLFFIRYHPKNVTEIRKVTKVQSQQAIII